MTQSAESFIPVSPSVDPAAPKLRQLLVFEFQPATGTYVQVQNEVVAIMDPQTGLVMRPGSAEGQEEIVSLLRALLRVETMILNELGGRESSYEPDDFIREPEEG